MDAGANRDPKGKQGLAHLVEHMMFRGTSKFRVSAELERMGASFNALTMADRVVYYETFPTEYLDRVLSIERDRMTSTVITEQGLEIEKRVIAEESRPVAASITSEDVLGFYRRFYSPAHVRLVLVGSFDFNETLAGIAALFETQLVSQSEHGGFPGSVDHDTPLKMMRALTDSSEPVSLLSQPATRAIAGRPQFLRSKLPNGMRVLLFSHPDFHTTTLEAYVRAGSYFEGPDQPQLASLTARVLQSIAMNPALHLSAVSFNTYIEARVLPDETGSILASLSSLLQNPRFSATDVSSAKEKLALDIARKQTWFQYQAFLTASRRFYPKGHPFFVHDIAAQIESVQRFTLDDVSAFHRAHYRPAEAILVLAGNVNTNEMLANIRKLFGSWKQIGAPSRIDIPRIAPKEPIEDQSLHLASAKRNEVLMTHPGLLRRNDSDYYAALIANTALGGSVLSSRLGNELRDRLGLVYEVRSEFFEATLGDGLWGITMDVAADRTEEAIAKARDIVRKFSEEGITEEEFQFHRSTLKGAFLVSLSIPLALAGRILDAEFFDLREDYVTNYGRDLDAVAREDVNRAIRKHFSADLLWAIRVGP